MTKKKIIIICLSAAFLLLAAAGIWLVSSLADKPSEKPDDTKEARQLVYTDEANLFESLTIKNANGEYTLIRDGDDIKIKGKENITLLPATSKAVFETFAEVYVVKTITENGTDGFGFDEPSAVLTLKKVDGTKVVYVLKNGEKTAVEVETGLSTGSQTEIRSGLNEGDEIVIR